MENEVQARFVYGDGSTGEWYGVEWVLGRSRQPKIFPDSSSDAKVTSVEFRRQSARDWLLDRLTGTCISLEQAQEYLDAFLAESSPAGEVSSSESAARALLDLADALIARAQAAAGAPMAGYVTGLGFAAQMAREAAERLETP